jgi:hypothetical protein
MHAQLVKLPELSGAPNVIIQILPLPAAPHPAMDSAFRAGVHATAPTEAQRGCT